MKYMHATKKVHGHHWLRLCQNLTDFSVPFFLIIDDCVNEYLTDYNAKIVEYIEDLRNKRSKVDIENGMEGLLMDAAMDDDQVIDPAAYLDKYKKLAESDLPLPSKKGAGSFFDESPI